MFSYRFIHRSIS